MKASELMNHLIDLNDNCLKMMKNLFLFFVIVLCLGCNIQVEPKPFVFKLGVSTKTDVFSIIENKADSVEIDPNQNTIVLWYCGDSWTCHDIPNVGNYREMIFNKDGVLISAKNLWNNVVVKT